MADIPESTNPVRIALEDVTPVIAAAFANDACLIWSGEHRAYWVAGGNGYTTGAAYAGRWTIADAYRQTKHCDPTKQIAFERVDATRAAPPAMDREAVVLLHALLTGYAGQPNQAGEAYKLVDATLSADAKSQREGATTANSPVVPDGWKVVPILPTDQMLHAGGGMIPGTEVDPTAAGIVWCFMLNAAPALSTLSADAIRQGEGKVRDMGSASGKALAAEPKNPLRKVASTGKFKGRAGRYCSLDARLECGHTITATGEVACSDLRYAKRRACSECGDIARQEWMSNRHKATPVSHASDGGKA